MSRMDIWNLIYVKLNSDFLIDCFIVTFVRALSAMAKRFYIYEICLNVGANILPLVERSAFNLEYLALRAEDKYVLGAAERSLVLLICLPLEKFRLGPGIGVELFRDAKP